MSPSATIQNMVFILNFWFTGINCTFKGETFMKKKIISILLFMSMAVHALSGCGNDSSFEEGGTMAGNVKISEYYAFK